MTGKQAYLGDVRVAKLALSRLDELAVLPSVAAGAFDHLLDTGSSPVALAEAVAVSPALSVKILSLAHSLGVKASDHQFSFSKILGRMPADAVRNAILAASIYHTEDEGAAESVGVSRLACVTHSLAVAHASRMIAQAMVVGTDANLAFMAGLMHDIGKLAIHELMPRGFSAIVQQAKMLGSGSCDLEREYLGLDHGVLGKYLARKWGLPQQIWTGIWLHHSHALKLFDRLPHVDIARIVFCADCLVRSMGLGSSGSFDRSPDINELAALIRVDADQLLLVKHRLEASTELESSVSRLNAPASYRQLACATQRLARQLGERQSQQEQENVGLRTHKQELCFVHDLCESVDVRLEPAEFCVQWARQWQRFFQTSKVCLFLMPGPQDQFVETIVVSSLMECDRALLEQPSRGQIIPETVGIEPGIHAIYETFDWLFEQLDLEFSPGQTKFMPLLFGGEFLGGLIFELNYPIDGKTHESLFIHLASVGSTLLHAVLTRQYHEMLSDELVGLKLAPRLEEISGKGQFVAALAEMAAGFAHELNNPLSVVAGRAQLLTEDEPDEQKKRVLRQIQENTHAISLMVDDLISYAEPSDPRPDQTAVGQILDEAVQLAQHKAGRDDWSISVQIDPDVDELFVDSAQIASALANILVNSVEAYRDDIGEIKIRVAENDLRSHVKIEVRDFGCGMDQDTLEKAATPFFSGKPAGRQRGMGIAYTVRIVELNRGRFYMTSRVNEETLVTIWLPTQAVRE
jgi:putative nucleotidyltransferase with HDIG domain